MKQKKSYRILYIASYFNVKNSSASIRNNSLAKGLISCGSSVDVLTVRWPENLVSDYFNAERNWTSITYSDLREISINSRLGSNLKIENKLFERIKKIIKDFLFFPDICYRWRKEIVIKNLDYDLIISSSDTKSSHFVGLEIHKKCPNTPWIQIWGDPWASDTNSPNYMKWLISQQEKRLISYADKVVYVSEPTLTEMKRIYCEYTSKLFYIPRGFYTSVISDNSLRDKNVYHLVYTGLIGKGRNIFYLAKAIDRYNLSAQRKIEIDVYGKFPSSLELEMTEYKSLNIYRSVDYEDIASIYAQADGLLYLSNSANVTQIPGKLYDYLGTQKSIVCLVYDEQDEVSKFLKTFDRCLLLKNEYQIISSKLNKVVEKMEQEWDIDERFSPNYISSQLLSLLGD